MLYLTQAPVTPVVPSLASPIVCVVMMAAIHHPGCHGSHKSSLTLSYYLVKVKIFKKQ